MGAPQVSAQALINEAERHKTWESLEACLMNLLTNGQVLDYKHEGSFVEVVLNGTNKPVKLPVRKPQDRGEVSEATPASQDPESNGGGVATAVKAVKTAQKAALNITPLPKVSEAPMGVVALVGLKTESYDHHARRLIAFVLERHLGGSKKIDATVEVEVQSWYRSLR